MNLLKSFSKREKAKKAVVREDAAAGAVGAGSIAGARGLLFSAPNSMIKRMTSDFTRDYNQTDTDKTPKKKKKKPVSEGNLGLSSAYHSLAEGEDQFDQADIISKLKGLEDKEKADIRDTVSFGIEDDDDQIVRVTVKAEQADEFEKALQAVMADFEEDESNKTEIAEVLYKLKDQFDIIDVIWPEIAEDEEEGEQQFGAEQGAPGAEGEMGAEGGEGMPGGEGELGDLGGDGGMEGLDAGSDAGGESEVQGLLGQVIDMMKADAAARKADAEARMADAKAREQEIGAKSAMAKIKQEEQFLDMEDYEKKQKEQDKEAKRLAQLAKWKRDMGGDADADEPSDMGLPSSNSRSSGGYEEEEAVKRFNNRISSADLARRLLGGRK